jgi:hypothetical protein
VADGEPRNVLLDSVSIYDALNHTRWIDKDGNEHDIKTMDPIHRSNCIEFLIDRAAALEVGYSIGEYFWAAVFTSPEYNDDADLLDEMLLNNQFQRSKDPEAWLETVPIMQRLRAAHDKFESDHNFAVSSL